jgi:hypothetical protein
MNIVGFHNENFTKNPVTTLSVPYKLEGWKYHDRLLKMLQDKFQHLFR